MKIEFNKVDLAFLVGAVTGMAIHDHGFWYCAGAGLIAGIPLTFIQRMKS